MNTLFLLLLSLVPALSSSGLPWSELSLSIERDHSTSSDQATLCRVRVVNHGSRAWPGRSIAFEARALQGGTVVATERGRFGLTLAPYGTLETLIGFNGRYDRFEVVAAGGRDDRRPRKANSPRRKRARAPS
jgi:hypothetical protein